MKILGREPVLWLAVVRSLVMFATAWGFSLSLEQIGAIYLVTEAALSLLARQQVTPLSDPDLSEAH